MARISLLLTVLVGLLLAAGPAGAEMYRYVDEKGNTHFADSLHSVPPQYRNQLQDITDDVRSSDRVRVVEGLNAPAEDRRGAAPSKAQEGPSLDLDSTLFLLLVVGGPVLFVLFALLVKSAAGWLGLPKPGVMRCCGILLVQGLAVTLATFIMTFAGFDAMSTSMGMRVGSLAVTAVIYALVFQMMLDGCGLGHALGLTVILLVAGGVVGAGLGVAIPALAG